MRKTFGDKDKKIFKETQKAWAIKSETYRQLFLRDKNPCVIVNFYKESAHAIKEPWVTKEITSAAQVGQGEFLRPIAAILSDKRKHKMQDTAIKSLATMLEIDRIIASGRIQRKAFEDFVDKMQKAQPEQGWTFDVVKN
jgi:hypothetical protein